ncbi:hypothetical protein JB92DRAFT_3120185 [Gautieria morchelliformis]|nr:hypothetical protein JB92DRAFT_3120185 [Gautieria morchelliformis]
MREMIGVFKCIEREQRARNPKRDCLVIAGGTPHDITAIPKGWIHNPEGIPSAIHDNTDGTFNLDDMDVWMWLKALAPRVKGVASPLRARLLNLFGSTDQWSSLVDAREVLTPHVSDATGEHDTRGRGVGHFSHVVRLIKVFPAQGCPRVQVLRLSITGPFPVEDRAGSDIPLAEIARWLARYVGVTRKRVAHIEHYVQRSITGAAFSVAAREGQQKVLETSHVRAAVPRPLTHAQLDQELARFRPPPQTEDPAVEAMLREDTGLITQADTTASGDANQPHPITTDDAEVPPEESRAPPAPYDDDVIISATLEDSIMDDLYES